MSAQRQKGTAFETLIVNYLQSVGFPDARRLGMQGQKDRGDITGLGLPITCELKNHSTLALGTWMAELAVEMDHAGHAVGAVIHKRKGKSDPALQYVTMDLLSFVQLLVELKKVDGRMGLGVPSTKAVCASTPGRP